MSCCVVLGGVIVVSVLLLPNTSFKSPSRVMIIGLIGLRLLNMHGIIPVIVIHVTTSPREFPMTSWMSGLVAMRDASKLSGDPENVPKTLNQYHSEPSSQRHVFSYTFGWF